MRSSETRLMVVWLFVIIQLDRDILTWKTRPGLQGPEKMVEVMVKT